MRYFLTVISLTEVRLHVVDKKDLIKFYNENPDAKCIDEAFYNKLKEGK